MTSPPTCRTSHDPKLPLVSWESLDQILTVEFKTFFMGNSLVICRNLPFPQKGPLIQAVFKRRNHEAKNQAREYQRERVPIYARTGARIHHSVHTKTYIKEKTF